MSNTEIWRTVFFVTSAALLSSCSPAENTELRHDKKADTVSIENQTKEPIKGVEEFDPLSMLYNHSGFEQYIRETIKRTENFWYSVEATPCTFLENARETDKCWRITADLDTVTEQNRYNSDAARTKLLQTMLDGGFLTSDHNPIGLTSSFHILDATLASQFDSVTERKSYVEIPVVKIANVNIGAKGYQIKCGRDNKERNAVDVQYDAVPAGPWAEHFLRVTKPEQEARNQPYACFNIFDGTAFLVGMDLGFNK